MSNPIEYDPILLALAHEIEKLGFEVELDPTGEEDITKSNITYIAVPAAWVIGEDGHYLRFTIVDGDIDGFAFIHGVGKAPVPFTLSLADPDSIAMLLGNVVNVCSRKLETSGNTTTEGDG